MSYRGQISHYTRHETLVLSLGVDPEKITSDRADYIEKDSSRNRKLAVVDCLQKRSEMFRRAFTLDYGGLEAYFEFCFIFLPRSLRNAQ